MPLRRFLTVAFFAVQPLTGFADTQEATPKSPCTQHNCPREVSCPVGGEKFEVWGALACSSSGSNLDGSPGMSSTCGGMMHRINQCPANKLPLYRDFNSDEIPRLSKLIETPEFAKNAEQMSVSKLSVWVESELGPVEPSWAGRVLLASGYWGDATKADSYDAAIPYLLEAARAPVANDSRGQAGQAQQMALLAFLLKSQARDGEASDWLAKAKTTASALSDDQSWAEHYITTVSHCIAGDQRLKRFLCSPLGIASLGGAAAKCLASDFDTKQCAPFDDLPGGPKSLPTILDEASERSQNFREQLVSSIYRANHLAFEFDPQCALRVELGIGCRWDKRTINEQRESSLEEMSYLTRLVALFPELGVRFEEAKRKGEAYVAGATGGCSFNLLREGHTGCETFFGPHTSEEFIELAKTRIPNFDIDYQAGLTEALEQHARQIGTCRAKLDVGFPRWNICKDLSSEEDLAANRELFDRFGGFGPHRETFEDSRRGMFTQATKSLASCDAVGSPEAIYLCNEEDHAERKTARERLQKVFPDFALVYDNHQIDVATRWARSMGHCRAELDFERNCRFSSEEIGGRLSALEKIISDPHSIAEQARVEQTEILRERFGRID